MNVRHNMPNQLTRRFAILSVLAVGTIAGVGCTTPMPFSAGRLPYGFAQKREALGDPFRDPGMMNGGSSGAAARVALDDTPTPQTAEFQATRSNASMAAAFARENERAAEQIPSSVTPSSAYPTTASRHVAVKTWGDMPAAPPRQTAMRPAPPAVAAAGSTQRPPAATESNPFADFDATFERVAEVQPRSSGIQQTGHQAERMQTSQYQPGQTMPVVQSAGMFRTENRNTTASIQPRSPHPVDRTAFGKGASTVWPSNSCTPAAGRAAGCQCTPVCKCGPNCQCGPASSCGSGSCGSGTGSCGTACPTETSNTLASATEGDVNPFAALDDKPLVNSSQSLRSAPNNVQSTPHVEIDDENWRPASERPRTSFSDDFLPPVR
ncbi:hypothetical protein [Stratiformator vulcanicus]|uniref:Uncharacterized protein n=1 Tax=Stratiformator vulcanicus TaxID=2527980 RepID=A0A517R0F6_9PLAN|nr:hypothetical protein [Stratiformator vulcanicus]QDT37379.1 hypothetical protein Pan189_17530 [Stratiformator vulcanicus]